MKFCQKIILFSKNYLFFLQKQRKTSTNTRHTSAHTQEQRRQQQSAEKTGGFNALFILLYCVVYSDVWMSKILLSLDDKVVSYSSLFNILPVMVITFIKCTAFSCYEYISCVFVFFHFCLLFCTCIVIVCCSWWYFNLNCKKVLLWQPCECALCVR